MLGKRVPMYLYESSLAYSSRVQGMGVQGIGLLKSVGLKFL